MNFVKDYIINDDLSIDSNKNFYLVNLGLDIMPIKFNIIGGYFNCCNNKLKSLEYGPTKVNRYFDCANNNLRSLKYSPISVGEYFDCTDNNLTLLEGMPSFVGGAIFCQNNNITSFKGIPEDFDSILYCDNNPICEIYKLFNTSRCIYWINEYDVIRENDIIIDRLEEVFHQLNMKVPDIEEIKGYNLI